MRTRKDRTADLLTDAVLDLLRRWPEDVQSAGDWATSIPRGYAATPAKVRTRLERLVEEGLARKFVHESESGKVTAVYFGLADENG